MKKLVVFVALIGVVGFVWGCSKKDSTDKTTTGQADLDLTVVAKVNDEPIFVSEVEKITGKMFQQAQLQFRRQLSAEDSVRIRQNALEWLIAQKLFEQEATRQRVEVSDVEVEQILAQLRQRFSTEEEFENALAQDGLTIEKLRQNVRSDVRLQKLLAAEVKNQLTPISEQAALVYYQANPQYFQAPERVHARHILFKVDKDVSPAEEDKVRKKAEQVLQLAKSEKDFAELAQKYSEGPTASKGGDLGFFGHGDMIQPFDEAVFQLEVGEISDLVKTAYGYHIIKLEEKKSTGTQPFQEVTQSIKTHLLQQKRAEAVQNYIEKLKKEANIEYMPESKIFSQGTMMLPAQPPPMKELEK